MNDAEFERILDRRVQARLQHDRAYLFAEDAIAQADREDAVTEQEYRKLLDERDALADPEPREDW